ncbi:MAG: hypothetical protein KJP05_00715 [Deltaproteobacteria bacterium]|nr:hypothetical protein [Deltaproteobacteria bacterium]
MRKKIGTTNNVVLFLNVLAVALISLSFLGAVSWSADYRTSSVPPTQIIPVDIKPRLCPNPLEVSKSGVVSVAILGTERLDVRQIRQDSVRLEEIQPEGISWRDVARPHKFYTWKSRGKKAKANFCTDEGPDGKLDLVLQVNKKDLLRVLGKVRDGDVRVVRLSAWHKSGARLVGQDVVVIEK